MKINGKQVLLYLSMIFGIALGILAINLFSHLEQKNFNDWLGIIGAMLSFLGLSLTIKSSINLKTYYASVKYIRLDKTLENLTKRVPEITEKALELKKMIQTSRGKTPEELDRISDYINNFCNIITNLFNDINEYNKDYNSFLHNNKENITKILSSWNSGADKDCLETLQYIHENLPKTVSAIRQKNKEKIDPTLAGIFY